MSYVDTPDEAQPDVLRLFEADRTRQGYVANYTKVFALRPGVFDAWARLNTTIKGGMDLRRYELATLAAARALRSSYCSLAHATQLRDRFHDTATVYRIAIDHRSAGLDAADVSIMDYAAKVATDAAAVIEDDVETLRRHGLSDVEIFDVALAAAARCFFSTVLDAVGTRPDHQYRASVEPELQQALTVGRPIATEGAS